MNNELKIFIFLLIFIHYFTNGTELLLITNTTVKKNSLLADTHLQRTHLQPAPKTLYENSQIQSLAKGIILKFHTWPNTNETELILAQVKKAGLIENSKNPRYTIWTFEWPNPIDGARAREVCNNFSNFSFLNYCEPNHKAILNESE